VRQSDAHAWSEVWLGNTRGWVRVDPTAAVAPERIEHRIDTALTEARGSVVFDSANIDAWRWLWREAGWLVDAADIGWHRWVLGFTDRQSSLLESFGLHGRDAWKQGLGIVLALGIGTALVMLPGLFIRRKQRDPILRAWQRLLQRLRRSGLQIPAWAGPLQVLQLASKRWPAQREPLERLVRLYIHLRYAQRPETRWRREFQRGLRDLHLS
jgi:protein-glutamine gamma-glutamyltransferase